MGNKFLYIETFGCQMNVHDSEQIATLLMASGYEETPDPKRADVIIVNTCSIREKPTQKVFSLLGRFRGLKRKKTHLILAIGGCLAQQWGTHLLTRAPYVDIVFGTRSIHRLPEMIEAVENTGQSIVDTTLREKTESLGIMSLPHKGEVSAFVTIMQGCNNFCSFCVVPYVRGREESRPWGEIVDEVQVLADRGIKEVTLLGQNVNSYGKGNGAVMDFPGLLKKIAEIEGIRRIRFTTSHPRDLSDDLIHCYGELDPLCEHIHLPVQSGSDRILGGMNRGYTRQEYTEKVRKLRRACPDISITSDVIVGFPGETEKDFQETIDLMKDIQFDSLFSFKYSPREGTAAAQLDDQLSSAIKSERLSILQALQDRHTLEKNRAYEGQTREILLEGKSKNNVDDVMGRTRSNRIVNVEATAGAIGCLIPVTIKAAYLHSLRGEYRA